MATNNSINTATTTFLLPSNNLSDVQSKSASALNLFVVRTISTATSLSSTDYGKEIICTGSSAYTVTLPSSSNGKFIRIMCKTTNSAIVTLNTPSGTINGQASGTINLGPFDNMTIYADGTNYFITQSSFYPVNARVYLGTNQVIATSSTTRIAFDTATYDIGPSFDLVTNIGRATPLWPGKYEVFANTWVITPVAAADNILLLEKNGALYSQSLATNSANATKSYYIIDTVIMNGSTDFIEIFFTNPNATNTRTLSGLSTDTFCTLRRISII